MWISQSGIAQALTMSQQSCANDFAKVQGFSPEKPQRLQDFCRWYLKENKEKLLVPRQISAKWAAQLKYLQLILPEFNTE